MAKKKKKTVYTRNFDGTITKDIIEDSSFDSGVEENYRGTVYTKDFDGNITKKVYDTPKTTNGIKEDEDIAPTKGGNKDSWFKSGGFSDGVDGFWDFVGDLGQTVAGTAGDIAVGVGKGITRMGEGVTDLAGYGLAGLSDLVGADNFADDVRNVAKDNTTDKLWKKPAEFVDEYSVLGNKADSVSEGLGQVGGILATAGLAGALGASGAVASGVSTGVVGTSAMGSGMSEAYEEGATDKEAVTYGTISGVSEAITEAIFGGLGKTVKALGVSKGLSSADGMLAKKVSGMFNNQIAKNFAEFGIKAGAEGTEEVLSGIAQAAGKSFTYMKDNEEGKDFWDILQDENLLEQFVVGTITSGIAQSGVVPGMKNGSLSEANKQGKDFITGLTENEQKVVDKEVENRIKQAEDNGKTITNKQKNKIYDEVVEDLDKGGISIDTIESALGGDTYKSYQDIVDKEDALLKEYEELGNKANATPKDNMRYQELDKLIKENKNNNQKATLKNQLADEVYEIAKDSRLAESYNEKTRKSQKYEADLSKYDEKQQAIVKKAIDSGILNNTNKTHDFVDLVAKMAADKDLDFDFTNNENLKKSGFSLEGKIINGYIKDGKIGVNIDSRKSLNSVVGHEITHVLEGTELYNELHKVVKEYAKTKGEYFTRRDELAKVYRNVENVNLGNEVVADLVGDYLFTDRDFVNNLSKKNPNIFKKIFNEIKYFCKIATAGSKEARQLEKVKRTFEKAYKEIGNNNKITIENNREVDYNNIKYSLYEQIIRKHYDTKQNKFMVNDYNNYYDVEFFEDGTYKINNTISIEGNEEYIKDLQKMRREEYVNSRTGSFSAFTDSVGSDGKFNDRDNATAEREQTWTEYADEILEKCKSGRADRISYSGESTRNSKGNQYSVDNKVSSKDDAFFDAKDDTKKSLSTNEISSIKDKTYGNYNVYGKDVALVNDTVTENNIAPIKEDNSVKTADNSLNNKMNKSTNEFNPYAKEVSEDDIETVSSDELRESKIENAQIEVDNLIQHRETSYKSYSDKIEHLQQEYDAKKNKDTKVANTILQRIERLKRSREDTDTKYKKDIGDRQNKLELIKKGYPTKRSEVQGKIIDDIKIELNKNDVDLDDTLLNGKNLSAIKINDNTPQRVFEKTFGSKVGRILSDLTVNKVARNETESIKWLNKYTNRKDGVLKELSDRYQIKPGSKESAAAQMYAEGFYVDRHNKIVKYGDAELAKDFPDFEVRNRIIGLAKNPMIRQIYDETLDMINDSRQRNGYPAIPKLENYYLHFRAMEDTFSKLGLPFNPNNIKAKDLPTDLNGVTADLQPGQPYFASANHRKGKRTSFDLLGGLEMYLSGAKNQIYHIDDIQTFRALRNYIADTFGQAKGLENLDELEDNQIEEMIEKIYGSHLSNFARFLNEEANVIAGKTALIDRGLEGVLGRRGMTFLNDMNSQVGSHMVGGNISSSLTNFLVITDAFSKSNKADFFKAFTQMVSNKVNSIKGKSDGFVENNPTMIRRNGAEKFNRTFYQKAADAGYVLMGVVDNISTELVTRTKYNECIRKGMTSEQAMNEADKWASRMMGDRSLGQQPLVYNSKMLGMFTKFQLEVRNFLDSALYDNIQDAKLENEDIKNGIARNAKTATKVTSTLIQLAIGQHLFGKAFEKMTGYNPAFDVIETIIKTFGLDDEEESEDTVEDNIEQGLMSLLEDLPYSSLITNGGRIPVTTALPFDEIFNQDNFSNKSFLQRAGDAIKEVAPYYLLPTGYGQIKKTKQGLDMFDEDLPVPGSYTESGNLRFPVEDTPANRIKAGIFGQWANENAREYFDSSSEPLKPKQIQEFKDLDIPIKDYRKYKKDISSKKKISEKADYINELDLPIDKKNILVNNAANRKEEIDMSNYNDFSDFEEFDFYNKNPKKYNLLKENNVSYKEYSSNEDTKKAYNWAYNNPDKYILAKSVTDDIVTYKQYTKDIANIKADTYANGKIVTGSRKNNVTDYINSLDIDYGQKIILYRKEFKEDDTYNNQIVEYVGNRQDLSFDNKVTILTQLGFTVKKDGTVLWD